MTLVLVDNSRISPLRVFASLRVSESQTRSRTSSRLRVPPLVKGGAKARWGAHQNAHLISTPCAKRDAKRSLIHHPHQPIKEHP